MFILLHAWQALTTAQVQLATEKKKIGTDAIAAGPLAKKRLKVSETPSSSPSAKTSVNGKVLLQLGKPPHSFSPQETPSNTKPTVRKLQTSLQRPRNAATATAAKTPVSPSSTNNDMEKTPINQSHSLKIRIPGLNSLNKSSATASSSHPSATVTSSRVPAASSSLAPRRSLRRRLSSHSGQSNGSSLTSMTTSSNQSMEISDS